MPTLRERVAEAMGVEVGPLAELHGGCVARVYRAESPQAGPLVIKHADDPAHTQAEAAMLADLAQLSGLPVPEVLHAGGTLLVMRRLPGSPGLDDRAQVHLARLVADLHGVEGPSFGYGRDTLIGPLPQPNDPGGSCGSWAAFFVEHRLLAFARLAHQRGGIDTATLDAAGRLGEAALARPGWVLGPEEPPTLVHGDLWSGNILAGGGRVTGVIDPAISYSHREIELAFMTLFGCVGGPFFDRYQRLRPIGEGFFERRLGLYQVYPLLVHAALFGAGYGRRAAEHIARALAWAGGGGRGGKGD